VKASHPDPTRVLELNNMLKAFLTSNAEFKTTHQRQALHHILEGKDDVLFVAGTGSGRVQ